MNLRRFNQVVHYGFDHAGQVAIDMKKSRWTIFVDIMYCYFKYSMWSNQYVKNQMWALSPEERKKIGFAIKEKNTAKEIWLKDHFDNLKFLTKWSQLKYETSPTKQAKRISAYRKRYNIGEGCHIGHNVLIDRHHFLNGTIKIGNHVLLCKNTHIDYSGNVTIEDDVKIAAGVTIESHHRDIDAYNKGKDINVPTNLTIAKGAYIGLHVIILDSCNYIGKNARIGAGAVVNKDIPDYSVAVGIPALVVKEIPHQE